MRNTSVSGPIAGVVMARKTKSVIPACVPTSPLIRGGIYVGVDQSLTGTGVVIFDEQANLIDQKLIATKPGQVPMDEVNRFITLFNLVHQTISAAAAGRRVCLLMEDFAYSQPHQMAALGGLGWHFRIMMSRTDWHFGTCSTNTLKKVATGKGIAPKEQVILGVYKRWTFEASDNNIADAYTLGRLALTAYAKPSSGTLGVRKDDLEAVSKLTIYR
jgi:crossover junction endodeoxyribonuclease RuvC